MAAGVDSIPLGFLRRGERAMVCAVMGPPEERHRIAELGMHEGAAVEMVQEGEPCILRVDGARFCFRLTRSCQILVERR